MYRFSSKQPGVAELYHENSKLSPHSTLTVPADDSVIVDAREWYFDSSYGIAEETFEPEEEGRVRMAIADLPAPLRGLIEWATEPGDAVDLLYGLDLFLLHEDRVLRALPTKHFLWVERLVEPNAWQRARSALIGLPETERSRTFLFLVGVPWRHMMFYGPRGYRHTLLDAGRFLALFEREATARELRPTVVQNFFDRQLDGFLLLDGVERSTLAVLALEETVLEETES